MTQISRDEALRQQESGEPLPRERQLEIRIEVLEVAIKNGLDKHAELAQAKEQLKAAQIVSDCSDQMSDFLHNVERAIVDPNEVLFMAFCDETEATQQNALDVGLQ